MLIAKFTSFCNDSKNHAGNDYDVDVWTMRWTDVLAMDVLARTFWPWTFLSDKVQNRKCWPRTFWTRTFRPRTFWPHKGTKWDVSNGQMLFQHGKKLYVIFLNEKDNLSRQSVDPLTHKAHFKRT